MPDIGISASQRLGPDNFGEVIAQVNHLFVPRTEETELLDWDHGQPGTAIQRRWGLSEEIQAVSRCHHEVDRQLAPPRDEAMDRAAMATYPCSQFGRASIAHNNHDYLAALSSSDSTSMQAC